MILIKVMIIYLFIYFNKMLASGLGWSGYKMINKSDCKTLHIML